MNNFSNISPAEFACKMTQGVGNVEALKHFGIDVSGVYMQQVSEQIKAKAEVIAKILLNGNSAEIKRNTDGSIKVLEVERQIIK